MEIRTVSVDPKSARITIGLCFLVSVLEGFDIQALGVVAPWLAPQLGISSGQLGAVFSSNGVGIVLGATAGGVLADRLGRRSLLAISVLLFGVFTLAMTLANSFETLVLLRGLAGLGMGAAISVMAALAAEVSRPERRASAVTMIFCGMPAGAVLASLYAGSIGVGANWREIFVVGGVATLALVPLLFRFIKVPFKRPSADEFSTGIIGTFFANGRARSTILIWLAFFSFTLNIYLLLNWLPMLAVSKGLAPTVGAHASLTFSIGCIVGTLAIGRLVDRYGYRKIIPIACVLLIASIVGLGISRNMIPVLIFSGLSAFFLLGSSYSMFSVAASLYPQEVRATGTGGAISIGRVGSILGPALAGYLLAGNSDPTAVFTVLAGFALLAGTSTLILGSTASKPIIPVGPADHDLERVPL